MYTCAFFGICLANYMTDANKLKNQNYNRPDLRPKAAMVKDEDREFEMDALT